MVSKFFVKSLNLPVLVGTGLGLLLPVLPTFAATPQLSSLEDSNLVQSEEFLIAQGGCPRATTIEYFETDTYYALICEDGDGDYFYYGENKYNGDVVNVYGVTFTDSGYYMTTTYDDYGNEYTYMVGPSLEVYQNGESIWYEPTY
jgi:hypothetical protein